MKLDLFTPVFGKLSIDELLEESNKYPQITALELGVGRREILCWSNCPGVVRHRGMEKSVNDVTLRRAETQSNAGALGMASITAGSIMETVYSESVQEKETVPA